MLCIPVKFLAFGRMKKGWVLFVCPLYKCVQCVAVSSVLLSPVFLCVQCLQTAALCRKETLAVIYCLKWEIWVMVW